jgi:hypothetical protein
MREQFDARSASDFGAGEVGEPLRPPHVDNGEPVEDRTVSHAEAGGYGGMLRQPRVRVGAVVALAVAVGLIAWLVVGGSDSKNSSSQQTPASASATASKTGPIGLTVEGLRSMSTSLRQAIYWAGEQPGYTYEFTRPSNGNVYVRYLPPGVKVGDNSTAFLIVVTYPVRDAYAALQRAVKRQPGKTYTTPDGGLAWVANAYPKSVHVAFPGVKYQVEVFDQSPQKALSAALSGNIRPVS